VNFTASGAEPEVTFALKFAAGREVGVLAEGAGKQHRHAVAHVLPHRVQLQQGPAEASQSEVDRVRNVLQGVHEGTVEVEDEEADGFHGYSSMGPRMETLKTCDKVSFTTKRTEKNL